MRSIRRKIQRVLLIQNSIRYYHGPQFKINFNQTGHMTLQGIR